MCDSRLHGGPLTCDRPDPHTTGCTFTASGAPDGHDASEKMAEDLR